MTNPTLLDAFYTYAWFVTFGLSFVLYLLIAPVGRIPFRLRQGRVAVRPDKAALAGRSASADRPGGLAEARSAKAVGPAG